MVVNLRRYGGPRRADLKAARRYRCLLDGLDVTTDCFYVDSRRGVVRLFKREGGRIVIDWTRLAPAWEERRGHVRLVRREVPPPASSWERRW